MALINCPECNKQVSDRATACPACACPISDQATTTATPGAKVQTIEATGKKWKGMQLGAIIALIIAVAGALHAADQNSGGAGVWASIGLISILVYLYARFGAWWDHK